VSSRLFSGVVAEEQRKAFTAASFHERRFFLMPESFFGATQLPMLVGTTMSLPVLLDFQSISPFSCFFVFLVLFDFAYTHKIKN
jgi:hypothetical protein